MQKWIFLFIITLTLSNLFGCASDGYRGPSGYDDGSNAHPAAYITDRFPVHRPLPEHESGPKVEFYFKRCTMAGDDWPRSHTAYSCDYP